ncbi:CHAP domain-containing protein [Paraconexibacter sp.]|uniref:CHAP domain-containing protein n=1 Tax=Paraconexibacter sp. TaxID=2949640 RepID=UPI003569F8AA
MSLETVIARISELQQLTAPRPPKPASATSFAQQLTSAQGVPAALLGGASGTATGWQGSVAGLSGVGGAAGVVPGASAAGSRRVALAVGELGVTEHPPGSNDGSRIAQYRSAMRGAPGVGPWCAYFTSWVAQQAGTPLGESGQGFASVDAVYAWAQRTGRAVPNSSGAPATPNPGDLIVWDEHIGVVESVDPDGTVHTIEGNSSDMVARRTHAAGSALGYVRL